MMKILDAFLKKLNVNRNTFLTYIFTLLTIYVAVDRIVEMMIMIFTGIGVNYWNPILYTLALACPVFAYSFAGSSSYADTRASKVTMFYIFAIGFYVIALSLFTQYLNAGAWLLFMSSKNFVPIVTNFSELIRPAFRAISLYLPLTTVYPFIKSILLNVDDTQNMVKSLWDFSGINLSDKKAKHGPYACDVTVFKDFDTGKKMKLVEERRFQSTLVCGGSGTGKTSMIFEPIIAQDIEKKHFFTEASKELGFTALKTGIASLSAPYSDEYLNKNFNLNMLTPSFGKDALFNTFVKKMVIATSPHNIYKNIGLTYMSPDYETLDQMMRVCDNYNVGYTLIDPSQPEKSVGLNPFIYEDPTRIAIIISSTLQGISSDEASEMKDLYKEETTLQILENLAILLKVIYPKMHDGLLPNMEDLLSLLSNFELVEKMCKILEKDEELVQNYSMELSYFKRAFFANSPALEDTKKDAFQVASRLENLLRAPKIRNILCNRHENVNFDDVLKNGEFLFICTRRGDSGKIGHKAFGLFFLLSMQNAVLSRPGNEKSRIPHFLYIDEFPDFITKDTETMFTMYRKYRVATTISAQSISQFALPDDKNNYNSIVLANCGNKIYTGGSTPYEELEWWSNEIGKWKQWKIEQDFDGKTVKMSSTFKSPKKSYEIKMAWNRLQALGQKDCGYKILNDSGKIYNGQGVMSYVSSKYKEKHSGKKYKFSNYTSGTSSGDVDDNSNESSGNSISSKIGSSKKTKSNRSYTTINSKGYIEVDPIQTVETKYSFDKEDGAIVIDLKNDKK
ncbi:MAG: TraM recognition domain-containing protein [Clostridia bacterium]|nr:TraM recognition domain-containing protein [Clostridia bacterium]